MATEETSLTTENKDQVCLAASKSKTTSSTPAKPPYREPGRKYNAREEKKWNSMSEHMAYFHNNFKREFNFLYENADGSFEKRGMSLQRFLDVAKDMNQHLSIHHQIEEIHIFPLLAQRMPSFALRTSAHDHSPKPSKKANSSSKYTKDQPEDFEEDPRIGDHLASHHGIHAGLTSLSALLTKWGANPSEYSPKELRDCLDGFREVLFRHLDEEVEDLKGDNMKRYWTLEEMERFPM